nr:EOG090X01SN [Lepidurus arcticus]
MSFLRGSANYVWCTTSVLGKGATGAVFQGVNKHTGEAVAVKTFNQLSHMRPQEVQMREFEVLKKVKHENIVKLLAIEEEQEGKGKVIVMELCTGGSLFNILDDPENSAGLPEDEFLLVLEHLSAGMKHLRDNNLVHRDLKPGNIMKFMALDGRTMYKLTDFGAARELEDDQQFMSLYGTEEYLHPDMYERAVLRKPVGKTFGATVDLWSIGVTLYHVATGFLPFRPFGGRRNKETMYFITAKKASGVISGVQTSENGEIKWNRELPDSCLLSAGIKKIVTPLFAGLMEVDPHRMWNFDRFFQEVIAILLRKPIHVFYVNKLQSLRAYILPSERTDELRRLLQEQTEIPPANQLLVFQDRWLAEWEKGDNIMHQTDYPVTALDQPVILFNKENNNVSYTNEMELPKFPLFPSTVSVETDAALAKQFCSVSHALKRRIEELSRAAQLMNSAAKILIGAIMHQLKALTHLSLKCQDQFGALTKLHKWMETFHQHVKAILSDTESVQDLVIKLDAIVTDSTSKHKELSSNVHSLLPSVHQLSGKVIRDQSLSKEWRSIANAIPMLDTVPGKANTYVSRLRESWQHLLRDRAARVLTYNDEQFHLLEKIKMQEMSKSLELLLSIDCTPAVHTMAEALADWYKMAQAVILQTEILQKDMMVLDSTCHGATESQERLQNSYKLQLHEVSSTVTLQKRTVSSAPPPAASAVDLTPPDSGSGVNKFKKTDEIKARLKELELAEDDIWEIVNETNELLDMLTHILAELQKSSH